MKNATWEFVYKLQRQFLHLVGKVFKGGGNVGKCVTLRTRFFF